jgi:hypothetical protein
MVKTGMNMDRRSALKRMINGGLASALLIGSGLINSPKVTAQGIKPNIAQTAQLEKIANSPQYCYWYYDNPFVAPNKEKDTTWDTLSTPEQRKSYVLDKFALDDTNKITPGTNWDCTQFSLRDMIHFFGFPESQNQDYNNAIYSMFRTNKEDNGKFNIPS